MASRRRAGSLQERLFRCLLYLYPRAFREAYGREMVQAYRDLLRDPGSRPSGAAFAMWILRDAIGTAIRAHSAEGAAMVDDLTTPLPTRPKKERETMLGILRQQIRLAVRTLTRNPGFATVTILTLGLGIGATTAIFSVVEAVLLSPLPYEDADRLVWVQNRYLPDGDIGGISHPEYWEYRQPNEAFERLAAFSVTAANLTGLDTPVRVQGVRVTRTYFDLLRTPFSLGRPFLPDEEAPGARAVAVISHRLWQSALGSDPAVVGKTIVMDGTARTIVGVVGEEHSGLPPYLFPGRTVDFWTPVVVDPGTFDLSSVEVHNLLSVGRLADGVTPESAELAMAPTVARLERRYPGISSEGNRQVAVTSLADRVVGDIGSTLSILLAAVGLVLIVACVNVANVMLARGEARVSEASVHAALGAGRGRLLLNSLTESTLIGIAGGALGLLLAAGAQRTLVYLAPPALPRLDEIGLSAEVFGFCAGVSLLAGLLAGLLPSFRLWREDLVQGLKSSGRSGGLGSPSTLLKRGLVVGQVAAAVVIASAAGLLGRSLLELRAVNPGFDTTNLLMVDVNAPRARYGDLESVRSLYRTLLDQVETIPGVNSATASWQTPLQAGMSDWPVQTNTEDAEWLSADPNMVSNSYFETLGIRLVEGRRFDDSDLARPEGAVIVSETAARRLFPDVGAVGRLVNINFDQTVWREIVGVVEDVHVRGLGSEPNPQTYVPFSDVPFGPNPSLTLTVNTGLPAATFRASLVEIMRGLDPDVPVGAVRAMDEQVALSMGRERFLATLLGAFAGAALLLGAIGVYGLLAYDVSRKRREIGLRIALGAQPRNVLGRVVGGALVLGGIGVTIGLAASFATARLLDGFLYGVSSTDVGTLGLVAAVVLSTALAAGFFPARRAASVDPLTTLREE